MSDKGSSGSPHIQILISCYNEGDRLVSVVEGVARDLKDVEFTHGTWVLDDGSTEWSNRLDDRLKSIGNVSVIHFTPNRGKGGVLNAIFPNMRADAIVVIDADNEYATSDIPAVVEPLIHNKADWVLGSRYGFDRKRPRQYLITYLANRFFNRLFNILSGLDLQDLLSGLFAFRSKMVRGITLDCKRFAFTPELMWKIYRIKKPRIMEVPISYRFRTYAEGKGIKWWEFFTVTWAIVYYRFKRIR